jgi:FkbM family methyltransferase
MGTIALRKHEKDSSMSQMALQVYAFLFARKFFYRINRFLFHASLRGLGILNYANDVASGERHFLRNYLSSLQQPTVVDVGANEGSYVIDIMAMQASAKIFAFEPHPVTYRRLLSKTAGFKNLTPVNAACGSACAQLVLCDYAGSEGTEHASLYSRVIEEIHKGKSDQHVVDVVNLDTFAKEYGISLIHLLKIDAEGHELEVLRGAVNLLRENRIRAIQFEFNEMNVVSEVFFKDFCNLLPNYKFYRMLRDGLIALDPYRAISCELFAYQNIVAFPKI